MPVASHADTTVIEMPYAQEERDVTFKSDSAPASRPVYARWSDADTALLAFGALAPHISTGLEEEPRMDLSAPILPADAPEELDDPESQAIARDSAHRRVLLARKSALKSLSPEQRARLEMLTERLRALAPRVDEEMLQRLENAQGVIARAGANLERAREALRRKK